ncbi:type II toxin-antitoxin system RelE/ParE family toxin [Desulfobacterota bacterium AH_259_B03_O07]|nr:type II toxin-antitoxin system RelE/ParE family toxin [Desulfobacterota bacterium AH_259_B03_O07]
MKLKWTRLALQDLRHLHEYIADDDPSAASRMVTRMQEATERLKNHPQMGRPGRVQGTRELVIAGSPYVVVYILGDTEIQISAIIHSAMRWPDTFR